MRIATSFALPLGLALVGFIFAPACDSGDDSDSSSSAADTTTGDGDSDSDSDSGGDTGADGSTPCGMFGNEPVTCAAGQYCADSVLTLCENGCLTNDNCAADQTCIKEDGDDVGSCQNNDPDPPDGPTEAEFCEKLLVCDMSGTMEQCSLVYTGTNVDCHQCIVDGNCGDIIDGTCDAACGF